MKENKAIVVLAVAIVISLAIAFSIPTELPAAKRAMLYPYKMILEGYTGFDSTVLLGDNAVTGHAKGLQGLYTHRFRTTHRDSTDALVKDSTAFIFDISDYDAGYLGYGYFDYSLSTMSGDSTNVQFLVHAQLGTEAPGRGWKTVRSLDLSTADGEEVDTISVSEAGCLDSLFYVSMENKLAGGVSADSVMMADKLRLLYIYIDSGTVGGTQVYDANHRDFKYTAFMCVKEEY